MRSLTSCLTRLRREVVFPTVGAVFALLAAGSHLLADRSGATTIVSPRRLRILVLPDGAAEDVVYAGSRLVVGF